jgi:hypothetical protein
MAQCLAPLPESLGAIARSVAGSSRSNSNNAISANRRPSASRVSLATQSIGKFIVEYLPVPNLTLASDTVLSHRERVRGKRLT